MLASASSSRPLARRSPRAALLVSAAALLCSLAASGCASALRTALPGDFVGRGDFLPAAAFPLAGRIMSGYDPVGAWEGWRVGDSALFGLLLEKGGRSTVRYVRLTLLSERLNTGEPIVVASHDHPLLPEPDGPPVTLHDGLPGGAAGPLIYHAPRFAWSFTLTHRSGDKRTLSYRSAAVLIAVDVYDDSARHMSTSLVMAPELNLRRGLYSFTQSWIGLHRQLGDEFESHLAEDRFWFGGRTDEYADLLNAVWALRDTLWSSENLVPVLQAMTPTPSLLSVLLSLQIKLWIHTAVDGLGPVDRPVDPPDHPGPALRLPLIVSLNGEPALRCELVAREPAGPLRLSAGVVAIDVSLPRDPQRRLTVRLLATQRGRGAAF